MRFSRDLMLAKIGYASQFEDKMEDVTANLLRLITSGECGFAEGKATWGTVIDELLATPDDLPKLNQFGARFSSPQWRLILEDVAKGFDLTIGQEDAGMDEEPCREDEPNDGQSWLPWHWTTNQWCVAGLCGSLLAAYLWLILLELGSRVDG